MRILLNNCRWTSGVILVLWVFSLQAQGPLKLVKDIRVSVSNSEVGQSHSTDDALFVEVRNNDRYELWAQPHGSTFTLLASFGRSISSVERVGTYLYFTTINPLNNDQQLLRSNGTRSGTQVIRTRWPNNTIPFAHKLIVDNDELFVRLTREVLRVDSATGTLVSIVALPKDASTYAAWDIGFAGNLYLPLPTDDHTHNNLMVVDIGQNVISPLLDINGQPVQCFAGKVTYAKFDKQLVIGCPRTLWRVDSTTNTAILVAEQSGGTYQIIAKLNNMALVMYKSRLWTTDGRSLSTHAIGSFSYLSSVVTTESLVFIAGTQHGGQPHLWRTDGTQSGTYRLARLKASGQVESMTTIKDQVFFVNRDLKGQELWRSDGTRRGTHLVRDLKPGGRSSSPGGLGAHRDFAYFHTGANEKYYLWRSDGTVRGTRRVKAFNRGSGGSRPVSLTDINGRLFFQTANATARFFWSSMWTVKGGRARKIFEWPLSSPPEHIVAHDNALYVSGYLGTGVIAVGTLRMDPETFKFESTSLTTSGYRRAWSFPDRLFISAGSIHDGYDRDGAEPRIISDAFTGVLKHIAPYTDVNYLTGASSSPDEFTRLRPGIDLFSAQEWIRGEVTTQPFLDVIVEGTGRELWITDGTTSGTQLVKDIYPGVTLLDAGNQRPNDSNPQNLIRLGEAIYFHANDGVHGRELWRSDGTEAGTTLVMDLTPNGDTQFGDFAVFSDRLFFSADDGNAGAELWMSDGSEAGTTRLVDINPGGDSAPSGFTHYNDLLYFSATDGSTGRELWVTDGTAKGTQPVADIHAGESDSAPDALTVFDKTLYFVADDGEHGRELWSSKGSKASTTLVQDLSPGAPGSDPQHLTVSGLTLYMSASDGQLGHELYQLGGTSHLTSGSVTRDASWYAVRPQAVQQCLDAHNGEIDLGYLTLKDETADNVIDATRLNGVKRDDRDNQADGALSLALGLLNADRSHYKNGVRRGKLIRQCFVAARHLLAASCNANWLKADADQLIDLDKAIEALSTNCQRTKFDRVREQSGERVLDRNIEAKVFNETWMGVAWPTSLGSEPMPEVVTPTDWDDPTDWRD